MISNIFFELQPPPTFNNAFANKLLLGGLGSALNLKVGSLSTIDVDTTSVYEFSERCLRGFAVPSKRPKSFRVLLWRTESFSVWGIKISKLPFPP